jgi:ubiquinone/menaquinone biosynthesis C-methylase UbiE
MATTNAVPIDPSNREQLRAWDGDEGAYWAAHPEHFERALERYHEPLFAAAALGATDRVLDIGCGTGKTTRDAARAASAGSVLGVDLSSAMLDVARRRAAEEGVDNVRFEQADAQIHPFERAAFDVAIGCTSAMFFGDRVAGLANIDRARHPRGNLVLLTWQPFPTRNGSGSSRPPSQPDAT